MTKLELQQQVLSLPVSERLELVEDVLVSIGPEELPVPDWQRAELRRRLALYGSEKGQTWEEVRAEIWPSSE